MTFKTISNILSGGGVSPIEQINIAGNMDVEEELDKVHKSMPMGSMYFRRVRTIDKSSADPHLGKKVWFMIGFVHTVASSANDGFGAQILFQYSNDFIMIRRIEGNHRYWIRFDGTRMD